MKLEAFASSKPLWKSLEIFGNRWKSLEIVGNLWKSLEILGDPAKILVKYGHGAFWNCSELLGNLWKSFDQIFGAIPAESCGNLLNRGKIGIVLQLAERGVPKHKI